MKWHQTTSEIHEAAGRFSCPQCFGSILASRFSGPLRQKLLSANGQTTEQQEQEDGSRSGQGELKFWSVLRFIVCWCLNVMTVSHPLRNNYRTHTLRRSLSLLFFLPGLTLSLCLHFHSSSASQEFKPKSDLNRQRLTTWIKNKGDIV